MLFRFVVVNFLEFYLEFCINLNLFYGLSMKRYDLISVLILDSLLLYRGEFHSNAQEAGKVI